MTKKKEKADNSLTLQALEKDKAELEQKIKTLQKQIATAQIQLYRFQGALGYINDNIQKPTEVKDDR